MRIAVRHGCQFNIFTIFAFLVFFYFIFLLGEKETRLHEFAGENRFPLATNGVRQRMLNISILVVTSNKTDRAQYSTALNTLQCYALQHDYELLIVSDAAYPICDQKDPMFRRHCVVASVLERSKSQYLLFLDADIAVVNPKRFIEEYIDPDFDLLLYDRFVTWEIAIGSYIAKNTPWTIKFLRRFADFEVNLPNSFHGTDNGALIAFLLEELTPELRAEAQPCYDIWSNSNSFHTLFLYEACMRAVMGGRRRFEKLRILKKGSGWVRDVWLANSEWSEERDFMLHGLKEENREELPEGVLSRLSWWLRWPIRSEFSWHPPLLEPLELSACADKRGSWLYDERLVVKREAIEEALEIRAARVEREKWKILSEVADYVV